MKNKLKGFRIYFLIFVFDVIFEYLVFLYFQENIDLWKIGYWLVYKVNLNRVRWSYIEFKVSLFLVCIVSLQSDINLEFLEF